MAKDQSDGRKANAATPASDRPGLVSEKDTVKAGRREAESAGPDGPDAGKVGETFKRAP